MRLIDADVLHKRFQEEIKDLVADEDKECMRYADSLIDTIQTADAMPIKWMQKAMIEMIYDGDHITEEDREIMNGLVARWEKENEKQSSQEGDIRG